MGCRGYLVGNGFSRVSRRGHRGDQEDHGKNGRKWQKMVEKSSPRLFGRKWIIALFAPWSSRQPGRQWQKWPKMAENGLPRLFGRKWISALYTPFPYYCYLRMIIHSYSVMSSHSTIESFSDPITSFNTFFFFCSQETRKHYADTLKSYSVQCMIQTLNQSNHH